MVIINFYLLEFIDDYEYCYDYNNCSNSACSYCSSSVADLNSIES